MYKLVLFLSSEVRSFFGSFWIFWRTTLVTETIKEPSSLWLQEKGQAVGTRGWGWGEWVESEKERGREEGGTAGRGGPFCKWDVWFMERMFWRKQSEDDCTLWLSCPALTVEMRRTGPVLFHCDLNPNWAWSRTHYLESNQTSPMELQQVNLWIPHSYLLLMNKKYCFFIWIVIVRLLLICVIPTWTCLETLKRPKKVKIILNGNFLDRYRSSSFSSTFPIVYKKPARPVLSQCCSVCSEPAPLSLLCTPMLKQPVLLNLSVLTFSCGNGKNISNVQFNTFLSGIVFPH